MKENADAIAAGEAGSKGIMPNDMTQWAYASLSLGSAVGDPGSHFGSPVAPLEVFGWHLSDKPVYIAVTALALDLAVTVILTLILRSGNVPRGTDVAADLPATWWGVSPPRRLRQ